MTNDELTLVKGELVYLVEKEFDVTVKEINTLSVSGDEIKVIMVILGNCEFLKHFYKGIMLKSNLLYSDIIDAFVGTFSLSPEIGPLTSKDDGSLLYVLYHPNLKTWEIISSKIYQQRMRKLRELIRLTLAASGFIEL
jgi:hypothetical protein